jgi:hypothetical protein
VSAGAYVLKLRLGELELDLNDVDSTGFIIDTVDLGYPTVKAVTTDLAEQDGVDDQTAYFGQRTIQLTGAIVPTCGGSRTKMKDKLAPFLAASGRPTLVYALDTDVDVRCFDLRVSQWSNPIDHPVNAVGFSVQWAAAPIAYGDFLNQVELPLSAEQSVGFSFPLSFPFSFGGSGGPSGAVTILNVGTFPSWPLLRIFGPCTDPSVLWVDPTTGESVGPKIVFTGGLVIAEGDYLEVDTQARTARINGDPGANRYNFVDFAATSWGQLAVGPNTLRFTADAASSESSCSVLWRESYLD